MAKSSWQEYLAKSTSGALDEVDTAPSGKRWDGASIYQGPQPDDGDIGRCEICSEEWNVNDERPSVSDIGEFWDPSVDDSIVAHVECGLSAGLETA